MNTLIDSDLAFLFEAYKKANLDNNKESLAHLKAEIISELKNKKLIVNYLEEDNISLGFLLNFKNESTLVIEFKINFQDTGKFLNQFYKYEYNFIKQSLKFIEKTGITNSHLYIVSEIDIEEENKLFYLNYIYFNYSKNFEEHLSDVCFDHFLIVKCKYSINNLVDKINIFKILSI